MGARGRTLAVTAVTALVLVAAGAAAATNKVPTRVNWHVAGFVHSPHHFRIEVEGSVRSREPRCAAHRRVELFFVRGHTRHRRDAGFSSRNGAWGLTAESRSHPRRFTVKAKRNTVDQGKVICRPDSVTARVQLRRPAPPG
jgi:hypothetical protein